MAIEPILFKNNECNPSFEKIINSGEYFTGIVYLDGKMNNWIEFSLVNKEKLGYILNDIETSKEVKFEIFSYARYPEEVQRKSNREGAFSERN